MDNRISDNTYAIIYDYYMDEYVPGHFSTCIEGYPLTLDFFFTPSDHRLPYLAIKMNVALRTAKDRSDFETKVKQIAPENETSIIMDSFFIIIEMTLEDNYEVALREMLDVLPKYLKDRNYNTGCARCGIKDEISLYQVEWGKAENVCPQCKADLCEDKEKQLERRAQLAKERKKKLKKASASYFIGASGRNLIPYLFLAFTVSGLTLFVFYLAYTQIIQDNMLGLLPTEISGLSYKEKQEVMMISTQTIRILIIISVGSVIPGFGAFKFAYGLLCRKGALLYCLGHFVMVFVTIVISLYSKSAEIIEHFGMGKIAATAYRETLMSEMMAFVGFPLISMVILYSVFLMFLWKHMY